MTPSMRGKQKLQDTQQDKELYQVEIWTTPSLNSSTDLTALTKDSQLLKDKYSDMELKYDTQIIAL
jgi:hypothetical protein